MRARAFRCPDCGGREHPPNELARLCLQNAGFCQGCRARQTFARRPEVVALFVDFWRRTAFPDSPSWLEEAVSAEALSPVHWAGDLPETRKMVAN